LGYQVGQDFASGGLSMRQVVLYTRVSTDRQTTENQDRELRAITARAGWNVVDVYRDEGISGAKGRDERPAFDALCKDAARRQFDLIMAWSVDRLDQDLIGFLSELHALGIDLMLHQQGLDTTTPAGKAMFQMMGVFAEFERAIIRERVKAGLERARAQGKALGRPTISAATDAAIRKALKKGDTGIRKIATTLGVGTGTVQRIKAEMSAAV